MPSRWELSAQEHPRHHAVMADHMPRLFFQMLEGSRWAPGVLHWMFGVKLLATQLSRQIGKH